MPITAKEKYKKLFGSITKLSDPQPWTLGLSDLTEHFAWGTSSILGISKTKLIKRIVQLSDSEELRHLTKDGKISQIQAKLRVLQKESERIERYDKSKTGYCTPREALRRNRFFSEDYLNAEFNIFLSLCSDQYLNSLYKKFIDLNGKGNWSTHGNSNTFQHSVGLDDKTQMDNLAYNETENILVANELKLGGKKNQDQILKYFYLFKNLEKNGLIINDCRFLLLFISDKKEKIDFDVEIEKEIQYVSSHERLKYLLDKKILGTAKSFKVDSLSWNELINFNEVYLTQDEASCQVERKLLLGFNQTLKEKATVQ